jgi:Raf kinase inhibitor-like YbhB/YbcL family protein
MNLKIVSRAFTHGTFIPDRYTCHGENVSPPLAWTVHWLLYNVQPTQSELDEGIPGGTETLPNGARQGSNGFRKIGYAGPCPPSGTHRYYFHLHAIDSNLNLPPGTSRDRVDQAIKNHVLEEAELLGYYSKT